jgi:predicted transcriptional regulator
MKTIEIDDETAMMLEQQAARRGLSISVAELAALDISLGEDDRGTTAELDGRWRAFTAQSSVTSNADVVKWLCTWGTPAFRSLRP